ncbi:MAG: hypothetical protein ACTSUN_11030 [Promethearchaeota archaeon]
MFVNDLKEKIEGKFLKEINLEEDGDSISYVFPDTKEFISILKRKMIKEQLILKDGDDS